MHITDEAVEAAASMLWPGGTKEPHRLRQVKAALEAAGPFTRKLVSSAVELDALPKQTVIRAATKRNPKFADYFERFLSGWIHLDPGDREDGESTVPSEVVVNWYGDESITVVYEPEQTFADRMAAKSLAAKKAKHAPKHSMHKDGEWFYACEACSGLPDGEAQ